MNTTSIHEDIQAQWFAFDSVVQILGVSHRTARTRQNRQQLPRTPPSPSPSPTSPPKKSRAMFR
jgi:hypothetical protein